MRDGGIVKHKLLRFTIPHPFVRAPFAKEAF